MSQTTTLLANTEIQESSPTGVSEIFSCSCGEGSVQCGYCEYYDQSPRSESSQQSYNSWGFACEDCGCHSLDCICDRLAFTCSCGDHCSEQWCINQCFCEIWCVGDMTWNECAAARDIMFGEEVLVNNSDVTS